MVVPDDFVPVLAESELRYGSLRRIEYGGTPILLAKRDHRIFALAETCSHLSGPLSEGEFIDGSVKCPWHGSRFALEDGRVLDGPAVHPQPCLEARVRNGQTEPANRTSRRGM
ncbi:MAG TPA: Rieske (2Fe-2S) protein [Clostridia bacterium]|nr:Rieske (2Fe-2S) protein [Clostridia bacterium]